VFGINNKVTVL